MSRFLSYPIPLSIMPKHIKYARALDHSSRGCRLQDIPGPRAWPVVGCLPDFLPRLHGMKTPNGPQFTRAHDEYYREFGNVYRLEMVGETQVTVCRPELFMQMYRNEGSYPRGAAEALWITKRWAEKHGKTANLEFSGNGDRWKDIRLALQEDLLSLGAWVPGPLSIVSPKGGAIYCLEGQARFAALLEGGCLRAVFIFIDLLSQKTARSYIPYITEAARLASPNFHNHAERPDKFVTRLAFDMFSSLFYGIQMKTASESASAGDLEFVENTSRAFTLIGTSLFNNHLKLGLFRNHPVNKEFEERYSRSYAYSEQLMAQAIESAKHTKPEAKPYIVRVLESGKIPKESIKEVTASLLLAGIDTTQSVLNWNLLYLAMNPAKQERLRRELVQVLGDGPLTEEVASKVKSRLPYLRAVVRETHRVAPPSPIMTSRNAPCNLSFEGFSVPAGTKVGFNVYSVQNDPKYVEDPQLFKPERWLPEAVQQRKGTDAEVIDDKLLATPFSFGARMCIGGRIAELETYVMLAQLIRDWRISTVEQQPTWNTIQPVMTKASPFPAFKVDAV